MKPKDIEMRACIAYPEKWSKPYLRILAP